jgi:hypothetical protein
MEKNDKKSVSKDIKSTKEVARNFFVCVAAMPCLSNRKRSVPYVATRLTSLSNNSASIVF